MFQVAKNLALAMEESKVGYFREKLSLLLMTKRFHDDDV